MNIEFLGYDNGDLSVSTCGRYRIIKTTWRRWPENLYIAQVILPLSGYALDISEPISFVDCCNLCMKHREHCKIDFSLVVTIANYEMVKGGAL